MAPDMGQRSVRKQTAGKPLSGCIAVADVQLSSPTAGDVPDALQLL